MKNQNDPIREQALKQADELGDKIKELARTDCNGLETSIVLFLISSISQVVSFVTEQYKSLSLLEAARRYSCTIPTIYNRLFKHNLPNPSRKDEGSLVFIPKSTLDELDKHYDHTNF